MSRLRVRGTPATPEVIPMSRKVVWAQRVGIASVLFFTAKGLLWLALAAVAAGGWFARA